MAVQKIFCGLSCPSSYLDQLLFMLPFSFLFIVYDDKSTSGGYSSSMIFPIPALNSFPFGLDDRDPGANCGFLYTRIVCRGF